MGYRYRNCRLNQFSLAEPLSRLEHGFFLNVDGYIGSANSGLGNVGVQHRANPESNFNASMTWIHGKHTVRFGGEYLYENRLETNLYETFVSSATQTCPTNASGLFSCSSDQGNALASMLLDVPSALTVNVEANERLHTGMQHSRNAALRARRTQRIQPRLPGNRRRRHIQHTEQHRIHAQPAAGAPLDFR